MASWWCQILYVQQTLALYLGEVMPIEQFSFGCFFLGLKPAV